MGMNPIPKAFGMDSFSKARCGELNQRLVLRSLPTPPKSPDSHRGTKAG